MSPTVLGELTSLSTFHKKGCHLCQFLALKVIILFQPITIHSGTVRIWSNHLIVRRHGLRLQVQVVLGLLLDEELVIVVVVVDVAS